MSQQSVFGKSSVMFYLLFSIHFESGATCHSATFLKLLQWLFTPSKVNCEPTEWRLEGNRYLFWQEKWRNWMQRKQKWAWRKWKMPSACYSPLREIKSPFLGGSWKVWMSARSSQVPPCRNLSLPGCLYNGSAINHHFWRCCRHLAWAIGGIRQLDLTNVAHFCPGAATPKWYHPAETQNGNYSTLSPVAQMQGLNIIIIIYVYKKVCIGFGAY